MIVDTRTCEVSFPDEFDVCIVGAGAVGIPMALELAGKNAGRVALLDAGGFGYDGTVQDMYRGEVAGDRHPSLHRTRFAGFGGSMELWAGWSRPLDPTDFMRRHWVENSGWPFGIDEVQPYFERANGWCGLGSMGYGLEEWKDCFSGESLADGRVLEDRLFQVKRMSFRQRYAMF